MTSVIGERLTEKGEEMQCKKPLIREITLGEYETAKDGHKYPKARIFSSDHLEEWDPQKWICSGKQYELIPCGKCIGCRIEYSRQWANRGYLESLSHNENWFVTLTYSDDYLYIPDQIETSTGVTWTDLDECWEGCLIPKDLQLFMKNLRKIAERELDVKEGIRFMACGEYGTDTRRPHYHLIIFGLPLPQESFYHPRIDWRKETYWQNEIIERAWGGSNKLWDGCENPVNPKCKGICNITEASWDCIAYVSRYVTKKINGIESEDYYAMQGEIKEFFRTSRDPGIAWNYYQAHKDEIYKIDRILIQNKKGSHWTTPPKYFDKLLKEEDPEKYEEVKERRKFLARQQTKLQDSITSVSRWDQLQIELRTLEEKSKSLTRPLVAAPREKGKEYGKARSSEPEKRRKKIHSDRTEGQKSERKAETQPGRN